MTKIGERRIRNPRTIIAMRLKGFRCPRHWEPHRPINRSAKKHSSAYRFLSGIEKGFQICIPFCGEILRSNNVAPCFGAAAIVKLCRTCRRTRLFGNRTAQRREEFAGTDWLDTERERRPYSNHNADWRSFSRDRRVGERSRHRPDCHSSARLHRLETFLHRKHGRTGSARGAMPSLSGSRKRVIQLVADAPAWRDSDGSPCVCFPVFEAVSCAQLRGTAAAKW